MYYRLNLSTTVLLILFSLSCSKSNEILSSTPVTGNKYVMIDTIAGNGEIDYIDGQGKKARIGYINGITVDVNGNIYFSEKPKSGGPIGDGIGIGEIRKIDINANVTTVFNNNGNNLNQLGNGGYILMYDDRKLLINDKHSNGIQFLKLFDPDTKTLTPFCSSNSDIYYFSNFVFSKVNKKIYSFNFKNMLNIKDVATCKNDIILNSPAINETRSIAVDKSQNIYISSTSDNVIYQYTPNNALNIITTGIEKPNKIYIDNNDNIYVFGINSFNRLNLNGTFKNLIPDFSNIPPIKYYTMDNLGNLICANDGLIFKLKFK